MALTLESPPVPEESGRGERMLPIAVNLLPEEVLTTRTARSARRVTIVLLLLAIVATVGWDVMARRDTSAAQDELSAAQQDSAQVTSEQRGFKDLVNTKASIDSLSGQLATLTTGSVAWNKLFPAIRSVMPSGVVITGLSATANTASQVPVAAPSAAGSTPSPAASTNSSASSAGAATAPAVVTDPGTGSIIITGTAPSKAAISQFVLSLPQVRGLLNPIVTSVTTIDTSTRLNFGLQVTVTKQALATRFALPGVK